MNDHRLMIVEEAADLLRTSPRSIRKWYARGLIRGIRVGRRLLFERTEIERVATHGLREPDKTPKSRK